MNAKPDVIGEMGLHFFGNTTASVSHDLKNALAIIQENAGLLSDYVAMADKGRPVDTARYKVVAARIEDQTRRADHLIKSLNRFAHTVDQWSKMVDLNEILDLLVILTQRAASMRQVPLAPRPTASPVMVTTAPFLLLILLGRCLTFALKMAAPGKALQIGIATLNGCGFFIEPMNGPDFQISAGSFPGEPESVLLSALDAAVGMDKGVGRMTISLTRG